MVLPSASSYPLWNIGGTATSAIGRTDRHCVEVIGFVQLSTARPQDRYPLRSTPINYIDPTESIAEADWQAAR